MRKLRTALLAIVCCLLSIPSFADDANEATASEMFSEAKSLEEKKEYRDAAEKYLGAELYSSDPVVKANSLAAAARAYRRAELYGKEFDCIEKLLERHVNRVNFTGATNRQYQIAELFFNGHRDVVFSWIPFIKDSDRTFELYEKALKNAPCAPQAPEARLRIGRLYMEDQKPLKAIELYEETIKLHPGTDSARYAYIELAHAYVQLAERGDGDGAWAKLAARKLDEFIEQYPNDPEIPWARKSREKVDRLIAQRLHGLGRFYHREGRDDVAQKYLARVIRDYANTEDAKPSEQLLADIDASYVPPPEDAPRIPRERYVFERNTIPLEDEPLKVAPENSDGRWLLPVRDMSSDIRLDSRKPLPERKWDDEPL